MKFFRQKTLLTFSIIVSLNTAIPSYAIETDDAVYIIKNDPAPYTGVLLPIKKAELVRKELIEADSLRAINESYVKSINLYKQALSFSDQKYSTLLDQNEKVSMALDESRKNNDLQKILWFGLGVLTTGFAVYGAKKITQ